MVLRTYLVLLMLKALKLYSNHPVEGQMFLITNQAR